VKRQAESLIVGAAGWLVRAYPSTGAGTAPSSAMEFVLAVLRCADGTAGCGWSYTTGVGGRAVLVLLEELAVQVVGWDSEDAESSLDQLRSWLHPLGFGGVSSLARAPIDIAVWDLRAKRQGLPLHRLWGAAADSVPAYGSGVDLGLELRELEGEVAGWMERGFRAVKVKVGRSLEDDLTRLRAVRKILGADTDLILDANQRWTTAEAIERSKALEVISPRWLEEPVSGEDAIATAAVRAATAVPVAAGESLFGLHELREFLDRNSVDVLQVDVPRIGGYSGWRKAWSLARTHNTEVTPHYAAELAVPLSAALEGTLTVEWLEGRSLADLGLVRDGLVIEEGTIAVPERPGIGTDFDWEEVARRADLHFSIGEWPS
jgi:L-alanine-DL-glutamate epimerase-like enolase superfamily enzyme